MRDNRSMKARTLIAAGGLLVAAGCTAEQAATDAEPVAVAEVDTEADPCAEAIEFADTSYAAAIETSEASDTVTAEPVDPSLSRDGGWVSPYELAREEALLGANRLRRELAFEAQAHAERWALTIEGNPECFDVDTRTEAAQYLRNNP